MRILRDKCYTGAKRGLGCRPAVKVHDCILVSRFFYEVTIDE